MHEWDSAFARKVCAFKVEEELRETFAAEWFEWESGDNVDKMGDLVAGVDEWTLGSRWSHDPTSVETFWRIGCPVREVLASSMSPARRACRI